MARTKQQSATVTDGERWQKILRRRAAREVLIRVASDVDPYSSMPGVGCSEQAIQDAIQMGLVQLVDGKLQPVKPFQHNPHTEADYHNSDQSNNSESTDCSASSLRGDETIQSTDPAGGVEQETGSAAINLNLIDAEIKSMITSADPAVKAAGHELVYYYDIDLPWCDDIPTDKPIKPIGISLRDKNDVREIWQGDYDSCVKAAKVLTSDKRTIAVVQRDGVSEVFLLVVIRPVEELQAA